MLMPYIKVNLIRNDALIFSKKETRKKHVAARQLVNGESRQQSQEISAPTYDDEIKLSTSRNRGLLQRRLYGDDFDSDADAE